MKLEERVDLKLAELELRIMEEVKTGELKKALSKV
jgi:hypothetical protein